MIDTFRPDDLVTIGKFHITAAPVVDWLTFAASGLRINMRTGEVVIPEGLSLDEASRAYWEGLSKAHPLR
jgi:hypothetical protein